MDLSKKLTFGQGGSRSNNLGVTEESATRTESSWDDGDLIGACLGGDEQAWTILIERYSRLIYTIPLRFGLSKPVADEIFQETCLILLEKLDTLRDHQRIASWLVTVTRRACIQRWRRKAVQTVELHESNKASDDIENEVLRVEQHHLVQSALENLKPRCQRLLKWLFFDIPSPSYDVIAEELNIPKGSIGPTRSRCLDKLRHEIIKLEQVEIVSD
jgi:RNA polymerase sigma factor (sigma-70 family)